MRVVMIGGTGFLGWFTCRALKQRGHDVIAAGLSPPAPGLMPDGVPSVTLDTDTCAADELSALLSGSDAVIHAAGADGRHGYAAPAIDGFRKANVEPMRRLIAAMRVAGTRRLAVFGSYYTALDRQFPELGIMEGNAYPLSRREQAELCFELAGSSLDVAILELPYIFGAAPGRGTLWGFYMDHVARQAPEVPVPAGGSACVTAGQVADAACGAVERSRGLRHYPICGENLGYAEIYGAFARAMGIDARFIPSDAIAALAAAAQQKAALAAAGRETGYDPTAVARWQTEFLYLDPMPAQEALGFGPADIGAAIADAVAATKAHGGQGPASLKPQGS